MQSYDSGMLVASIVQAGGEVTRLSSSTNNAMGVSDFEDLEFRLYSDANWYSWNA